MSEAQTAAPLYRAPDTARATNIREKLVQLAMQNPAYEMADRTAMAASYQVSMAKSGYLGLVSAQGNVNEFTVNPPSNNQQVPYYYPRYNLGVNIPFNVFTTVPNNVKIARQNYLIAVAAKNNKFREIKAEVLSLYENYLLASQLAELQVKLAQGEFGSFKRAESDFTENLIKLDEVEAKQKTYLSQQVVSLTAQRNLAMSKIELERVIGVKIEDVEGK